MTRPGGRGETQKLTHRRIGAEEEQAAGSGGGGGGGGRWASMDGAGAGKGAV